MEADEAPERLVRRRLLRFATETQDETVRMTEDYDPTSPVGQALDEIEKSCRRLIQMLESSARMSLPEGFRDD